MAAPRTRLSVGRAGHDDQLLRQLHLHTRRQRIRGLHTDVGGESEQRSVQLGVLRQLRQVNCDGDLGRVGG